MIPTYKSILIGIFSIGLCCSCLKTEISLQPADYKLIDSLYTKQKDSLATILEADCEAFQDSVLTLWIDSIRQKREFEIQQLITKDNQDEK